MQGIVTLLDGEARDRICELWEELRRDFGVSGIHAKRFPHFSFHVAEEYDLAELRAELERMAGPRGDFPCSAAGSGFLRARSR